MGGRQDARAGLFVDDDALVLPQLPRELVGAAVDRIDARRAAAEQHVGEPPGRRPDIDRDRARHLPAEMVEPVRELDPPARPPRRSDERRVGNEGVSKCRYRWAPYP